jgi:DNA polymerase
MQKLTLDFETYYDDVYSLRKMPTAQYVYDERFHIHGLGVKFEDGESRYFDNLTDIENFLDAIDWNSTIVIGHNLLFDALILKVHFHYVAAEYIDTKYLAKQVMSYLPRHDLQYLAAKLNIGKKLKRALHNVKGKRVLTKEESEELGIYCKHDCDLTWGIYDRLFGFSPEKEFKLMSLTTRMMVNPQFEVDVPLLKDFLQGLEEERAELVKASGVSLTTLRSTAKMVAALEPYGVTPPQKVSPSDPDGVIMINTFEKDHPEIAELLIHPEPAVRNIIKARLNVMSSIQINRAKRFIAVGEATGGVFPIPLVYCAAHTGRWGGTDKLNAQNIPPGPLREALMAPRHHVVLPVDLGQIEARITAWLAEHFELLLKFADPDLDPYCDFAAEFFNMSLEEVVALGKKSKERFVGKTCILGLGFGMGWKRLRYEFLTKHAWTGIVLSKDDAFRAVDLYRTLNLPIKLFWDFLTYTVIPRIATAPEGTEYGYKCFQYGKDYIRLPSGRCLLYPNLRATEGEWPDGQPKLEWIYDYKNGTEKLYGGKLTENLAQGIARDLNGDYMLEIDKEYPLATMTHDENVVVVHKAKADEAYEYMHNIMTTPPEWAPDLPLEAEGAYNERYTK